MQREMSFCPDFLLIGAQKSGTTSLYAYLNLHPELFMSDVKEPHFFCAPGDGSPVDFVGVQSDWEIHLVPDPAEYEALFADARGRRTGEASASYLVDRLAAPRIVSANPDVRLVVVLRDPVERAISGWRMWQKWGGEKRELADAIADELQRIEDGLPNPHMYLAIGRYVEHLEWWEQYVNRSQLCIVLTEDLEHDRVATLQRIFAHLGVDDTYVPDVDFKLNRKDSFEGKTDSLRAALRVRHSVPGRVFARLVPENLRKGVREQLTKPAFRPNSGEVPNEVRAELREYFRETNLELQRRYDLDLRSWLTDPDPDPDPNSNSNSARSKR